MKIAIVGCGALGSFYGARLARAGQVVHFLLRSDFEVVRRDGLFIESCDGNFRVRPACAKDPGAIGVCDVVLIGLKTTAHAEFARLLPPLVGPQTLVVTLQNGLGNEEQLAAIFGPQNILGGLCFVCLNRVAPGHIVHSAHGRVLLGEFQRPAQARTHALAKALAAARIRCDVTDDLAAAHWEKLVWNVPFNGLGVAGAAGYEAVISGHLQAGQSIGPCLTTDFLLADAKWEALVGELMNEVVAGAAALGMRLPAGIVHEQIERTRVMGAYKASTLVDFELGRALEIESLFAEPLRRAAQAGCELPRLRALVAVLEELQCVRR